LRAADGGRTHTQRFALGSASSSDSDGDDDDDDDDDVWRCCRKFREAIRYYEPLVKVRNRSMYELPGHWGC